MIFSHIFFISLFPRYTPDWVYEVNAIFHFQQREMCKQTLLAKPLKRVILAFPFPIFFYQFIRYEEPQGTS